MLKRIELTNFMSHAHTVIEPAEGLTVLVGPNNCGKSAVVAALQILCHNDDSTYVMRHGERECSIKIETDDGHTIEWRRKASPGYFIDGKLFDRLGRGKVPDELHPVLRLPQVDAGDESSFDIHFGCQKSPIFLLDRPKSAAAKFFGASSDASRLLEMQRRHRDKQAEKQREKTRLEAESKQLNAELDTLQPATGLDHRLKACEELHIELVILAAAIGQFEGEASKLEGQFTAVAYHESEARAFCGLAAPPDLEATAPIEALCEELETAQAELKLTDGQAAVLSRVQSPPPMADPAALGDTIERIERLSTLVLRSQQEARALNALTSAPALEDTAHLESLLQRLAGTGHRLQVETGRQQALGAVVPPPQPEDAAGLAALVTALIAAQRDKRHAAAIVHAAQPLTPPAHAASTEALENLVSEWNTAARRSQELKLTLQGIAREHGDVAAAIRELAASSVCPTCGAPLDAERLLAGAAAGGHAHE